MNAISFLLVPAVILSVSLSYAQIPAEPSSVEPLVELTSPVTQPESGNTHSSSREKPPATRADATPAPPVLPTPQKSQMQPSDEGYLIKDAPINDIFQFLAKSAGRQYFHNAKFRVPSSASPVI